MANNKILPQSLINSGISLDTHIFRYRSDRDFVVQSDGVNVSKNIITEEIETYSIWHSAVGALNDPFEIYAKKNIHEFERMTKNQKINLWLKVVTRLGNEGLMALSSEEILYAYEHDKERLEKTVKDVNANDTSFSNFIKDIRETIGIACFTSVCDSRLMWGYYCNGLSGVCLIYNIKSLLQQKVELNTVSYLDGAVELNVLDFVYNYMDEERATKLSQIVKTKHIEWAHELESRSVVDLRGSEIGKGRLIKMNRSCIDGVIVGRNTRPEIKTAIENLSKKIGFRMFDADVDYQLFGVKIV